MLNWANQFNIFCMLDSNEYDLNYTSFECILAVGSISTYQFNGANDFENLQKFYDNNPTWLFGHLGYNAASNAYHSKNEVKNSFNKGFFFEPITIIKLNAQGISVIKSNVDDKEVLNQISNASSTHTFLPSSKIIITPHFTKQAYVQKIIELQKHIKRGNCYEMNFCQPFFAKQTIINPIEKYLKLVALSPTPFAALYKNNDNYCLCASPERFLKKIANTLLSQPIKGTSKRNTNPIIDNQNKNHLVNSQKEKSENVMVVDMVRNDLSSICTKGSVHVKELFGIYSFAQVHQMISTVVGSIANNTSFANAIQACYPMASMTGAPKPSVMQLIEQYEPIQRGLFSGSIGYIKPNNDTPNTQPDFDFNVVIRSIFYNTNSKELHFFAGSGITFLSNAEEEYEECMAKAEAIIKVLS